MPAVMTFLLDHVRAGIAQTLEPVRFLLESAMRDLAAAVQDKSESLGLSIGDWTSRRLVETGLVLAAVAVALLLRPLVVRAPAGEPHRQLAGRTRGARWLGYSASLVLIAVFGGWSLLAPLASASIAPGVVSPDGSRKTIQHLEGGIVRAIHVREGDRVVRGQRLITLDDTQAKALHAELRERFTHFLAVEARLKAEAAGDPTVAFPEVLHDGSLPGAAEVMGSQQQVLDSRRKTQAGRERILAARIAQYQEQNAGLHQVIAAQNAQLALIEEEIVSTETLYERGLERLPRLLGLKRGQAEIQASQAQSRARIAENLQAIGETEMQLLTMGEQDRERVNDELSEVQRRLAELRSQLPSREDLLTRTIVRAPISGVVMNVHVTTETGVVRSGEPMLEIVPEEAGLIIDARVRPTDIDRVRPGCGRVWC